MGGLTIWILKFLDGKKALLGALTLAIPMLIQKFPEYAAQIQPIADFVMQNLQTWTTTGTFVLSIGLAFKLLKLILALLIKMFPGNKILLAIEELITPRGAEVRELKKETGKA